MKLVGSPSIRGRTIASCFLILSYRHDILSMYFHPFVQQKHCWLVIEKSSPYFLFQNQSGTSLKMAPGANVLARQHREVISTHIYKLGGVHAMFPKKVIRMPL